MEVWIWIWLVLALKLPLVAVGWLIWHIVKQAPNQEVIGGGEGGVRFDPGPRKRGPHDGGRGGRKNGSRRRDAGHDKAATTPSTAAHVPSAD